MIKNCKTCGKEIKVKPSHFDRTKFCSKDCLHSDMKNRTGELNNNFKNAGKKVCNYCGKEYKSYVKSSKFCSHKCSSDANIGKKLDKSIHKKMMLGLKEHYKTYKHIKYYCKCGNEILKRNSQCRTCMVKSNDKRLTRRCKNCGKVFRSHTYIKKFCCKECFRNHKEKSSLGELNPNWKGGVKSINQIGRGSRRHNDWINSVFTRDNYTCAKCGQVGGKLNAHHIKEWAKYPKLRYVIDNGITLCVDCHHIEHNWNTTKLMKEFSV